MKKRTQDRWKMRCPDCGWLYPQELLNRMASGNKGVVEYSPLICAPCALERTNAIHGVIRASFQGEIAEQMRQDALEWRREHPDHGPTGKQSRG